MGDNVQSKALKSLQRKQCWANVPTGRRAAGAGFRLPEKALVKRTINSHDDLKQLRAENVVTSGQTGTG